MQVRNCGDIGINAQYIIKRLLANQNLLKLLYYTDKDPLSHEDLTQEQIQNEVFEKFNSLGEIISQLQENSKSNLPEGVKFMKSYDPYYPIINNNI